LELRSYHILRVLYIESLSSAKREDTVSKRIMQMMEELRDGGRYMKMEYTREQK